MMLILKKNPCILNLRLRVLVISKRTKLFPRFAVPCPDFPIPLPVRCVGQRRLSCLEIYCARLCASLFLLKACRAYTKLLSRRKTIVLSSSLPPRYYLNRFQSVEETLFKTLLLGEEMDVRVSFPSSYDPRSHRSWLSNFSRGSSYPSPLRGTNRVGLI